MSRQRTLSHPRSCPCPLSSLLLDDIYNLAVHCLTQHAGLPQLWHRAVKLDIQSRSQQWVSMLWASLSRRSKASVGLRTGDLSNTEANLSVQGCLGAGGVGHYLRPTTCLLGGSPTRIPSPIIPAPTHGYSSLPILAKEASRIHKVISKGICTWG